MTADLALRAAADVRFDVVALGEVMLRLDPGMSRVRSARTFDVWEGGGEYNVARGASRCFRLRSAIVTALADNDIGALVQQLIAAGGVDSSHILWVPYDGIGRTVRNGLNFTERGFGVRGALGVSDRANTAASQMRPGQVDWDRLFGELGTRWFHSGGVFAALSPTTSELVIEAMDAARRHGIITSYDLNYRSSLWSGIGGLSQARAVNRAIAEHVDVMLGNEEDFEQCLGIEAPGGGSDGALDPDAFAHMIERVLEQFPNLRVVTTTLREVHSASSNGWGAIGWSSDSGFVTAQYRPQLEIFDRVGGGDSFASGLIYGLLTGHDLRSAVDLGAAHGALAMTTPGDTSMATLEEVHRLAGGGNARVQR